MNYLPSVDHVTTACQFHNAMLDSHACLNVLGSGCMYEYHLIDLMLLMKLNILFRGLKPEIETTGVQY